MKKKVFYNATDELKTIQGKITIQQGSIISVEYGVSENVEVNVVDIYGCSIDKTSWLVCTSADVELWLDTLSIESFSPSSYPTIYTTNTDETTKSGIVVEAGTYQVYEQQFNIRLERDLSDVVITLPKSDFSFI
jgi:hypothetical protein